MNPQLAKARLGAGIAMLIALGSLSAILFAQAKVATVPAAQAPNASAALLGGDGVMVDRVVAVVNGDVILESDVDEERRFQAFQPFSNPENKFDRQEAVQRLVDRTLILQQAKLQPDSAVSMEEAAVQLASLRKNIPACKQYQCDTDAGWQKFVQAQGFSVSGLTERWRQRMQVLKFIEMRFRMGIRITPQEIKDYYDTTLLPAYAKRNATAPKVSDISDRIEEVLLQQQVSNLLADWLKTLRAQGTVRVMTATGETA